MPSLCMEEVREPPTITCMSAAPLLKKMKVLKKIKKKIGLSADYDGTRFPPLTFHDVCGENIRIENNGKVARRVESFCKGITFSSRVVKVGEHVTVKLSDVSVNWSGVIRFGFTSHNPSSFKDSLPKYACPDLTNRPGFWAKALNERYAIKGIMVSFYLNSAGEVHYSINGEDRGMFFNGVPTRGNLWVLIDVYGNSTAIEYLDRYEFLNNRISSSKNNTLPNVATLRRGNPLPEPPSTIFSQSPVTQSPVSPPGYELLPPHMAQLAIDSHLPNSTYVRYPFHSVSGRNVIMSPCRTIAHRVDGEYSRGYVFGCRPMRHGERFVIRVLETEPGYVGALAFGMTSVNPDSMDVERLPEDCDLLLDRPEYWVVSKDVASTPLAGEELTFGLTSNGEVTFSRKNGPTQTLMHVDQTLFLWPFFDIYGNTKKIKVIGSIASSIQGTHSSDTAHNSRREHEDQLERNLRVILPPPEGQGYTSEHPHNARTPVKRHSPLPNTNKTVSSSSIDVTTTVNSSPNRLSLSSVNIHHECTVCYEKPVDCVLYTCGHMCMCYECAVRHWRFRGGGFCPICRAPIRDVIRTYRS